MRLLSYRRAKTKLIFVVFIIALLFFWPRIRIAIRDFIYITRPLWQQSPNKWTYLYHYSADESLDDSTLCRLHNWTRRPLNRRPLLIDAVIFSVELDLLEIRLRELWSQVDVFIVLEADRTFTGRKKKLVLKQNLQRFAWAKEKLRIESLEGVLEPDVGDPFDNEDKMRVHMAKLIKSVGVKESDIILVSDVDEIPRSDTLKLFKTCVGYPATVHLELKTYVTSFEFFFSYDDSWRAHVKVYDQKFIYDHKKESDYILPDAGWHCTFCFRFLEDFIFKMTSYSHNDRVTADYLLDKQLLQQRICSGRDVFEMYPEVYSFKEMLLKFGELEKAKTLTHLPRYLLENADKFRFLLPGGCWREDAV